MSESMTINDNELQQMTHIVNNYKYKRYGTS